MKQKSDELFLNQTATNNITSNELIESSALEELFSRRDDEACNIQEDLIQEWLSSTHSIPALVKKKLD